MISWCRLWHDMPTDPKWKTIAKRSGKPIELVIAIMNFIMVNASANATERGRTHNLFADDIGAALDRDEGDIQAVLDAMKDKIIDKDGWLTGWKKRQPKREDNSAERAKEWRESQKTERNRTRANAVERPYKDINGNNNIKGKMNENGVYERLEKHGDMTIDKKMVFVERGYDDFDSYLEDFVKVTGHHPKFKGQGFWAWVAGEALHPKGYKTIRRG